MKFGLSFNEIQWLSSHFKTCELFKLEIDMIKRFLQFCYQHMNLMISLAPINFWVRVLQGPISEFYLSLFEIQQLTLHFQTCRILRTGKGHASLSWQVNCLDGYLFCACLVLLSSSNVACLAKKLAKVQNIVEFINDLVLSSDQSIKGVLRIFAKMLLINLIHHE